MEYDIIVEINKGNTPLRENKKYEIPCEAMTDYAFFEIEIHEMDDLLQSLDSRIDSGGSFVDQIISAITKAESGYSKDGSTKKLNLVLAGMNEVKSEEIEYVEDWDLDVSVYVRSRE